MRELHDVPFATLTTLRVGGPAARLVEVSTGDELIEAVTGDDAERVLVIGGGSNLVVSDAPITEPVVAVRTSGVAVERSGGSVTLRVAAGESWDALVEQGVREGWVGIEALSGIPGTVGATPVQNVGAYGQEVCDVITGVRVVDRRSASVQTLKPEDCQFRYRSSLFKDHPERFVVLEVEFRLSTGSDSGPLTYAELARQVDVPVGGAAPIDVVRQAVLELRSSKGMVLDSSDNDTWSAGSFFTNPILAADQVPTGAPAWPTGPGRAKTSAAWLIERAGFHKGFGDDLTGGRARLSSKHTLAITNRGSATADDVVALARAVRSGVEQQFGIRLEPEPTLVGVEL